MDVDGCFFFLGGGGWEHANVFSLKLFFIGGGGTRLKVGVVVFLVCFLFIYVFFVCINLKISELIH